MLVINLFAGPGAGKSTTAAGLFALMKANAYKVELVTEFAKELVYARNYRDLDNQLYVTAEQARRVQRLADTGAVDYVITDSPILLGSLYAQGFYDSMWMHGTCWALHKRYDSFNVRINRVKPYVALGRRQSEESARALDAQIDEHFGGLMDLTVNGDTRGQWEVLWALKDRGLA